MPWKIEGKKIYKKKRGKWVLHQVYKSVKKARSAFRWLKENE